MRIVRIFFFILFLFCTCIISAQVLPSFGDSRAGTAGLQFLKIWPDARSSSLSGSYASIADDVSSVYWNPAGLTMMDSSRYHFQFGHTGYFAGVGMNYMGLAYSRKHLNFWGISLMSLTSGEMPVTTEFEPAGNGQTFNVSDLLIGISFAKILSDNFSFGLSTKYVYENIADVTVHNGIIDFGFIYSIGTKTNTRFSVGISNFGFNVSPSGKVQLTTLSGNKEVDNFEKMPVPSIFRLGVSTDLIKKKNHFLVITGQLNHPTDNNETVALGLEYAIKKLLYLRTGYEFGTAQKSYPSFGLGLNLRRYFGNFKLDYSFNTREYLGNVHRITFGIDLKKIKK
jgi:hypothetical protein